MAFAAALAVGVYLMARVGWPVLAFAFLVVQRRFSTRRHRSAGPIADSEKP